MPTTTIDSNMLLNDLKKSNKMTAERIIDIRRNHCISSAILFANTVRISGKPLKWVSKEYFLLNASLKNVICATVASLALDANTPLFICTPSNHALESGLYNKP